MNENIRKFSAKEYEDEKKKIEKLYMNLLPKVPEAQNTAKLILPDGSTYDLPILKGTDGPPMVDIRNLYSKVGHFTFDPGYTCTGSTISQITFTDGDRGILRYRGYDIADLAKYSDFMDTCYLLLYGELPSQNDRRGFSSTVQGEMLVTEQLISFYKGFQSDAHPMSIMVGVVGALSAFMDKDFSIKNPVHREITAIRLIAKMPMIAAIAYRTAMGLPIVYPKKSLTYAENFLYMMFGDPMITDYHVDSYLAKVLDTFFVLHADNEQGSSTSTVRIASSSIANPFACIAAGIASLWGPAHGGASTAVLDMFDEIGAIENIPLYIEKIKRKEDNRRLMGFGHRIYRQYDPRADITRNLCYETLDYLGIKDDFYFKLALATEKAALSDQYFIDRKLYPNLDFYSGILLNAIGIPRSMFTVVFALGRSIGWIVQWREMISDPLMKLGRPRQLYVGHKSRKIKPVEEREDSFEILSVLNQSTKTKRFFINKP